MRFHIDVPALDGSRPLDLEMKAADEAEARAILVACFGEAVGSQAKIEPMGEPAPSLLRTQAC